MTIKELEVRCGLDRATIRFYEKEGLLAPVRRPNGYREYSEEDALTLEKVSLLRQLDLPLEVIRSVQRGETPLGVALEKQQEALRAFRAQADRALHIAESIRKDGASYNTLQPLRYRAYLPAVTVPVSPGLPESLYPAHGYRCRRVAARLLDLLLLFLPILLLLCYGVRPAAFQDTLISLVFVIAGLLQPFAEALLLCTWGWTPGKWLMGLQLRFMGEGTKPTYGAAFKRCWLIYWYGFGLFVPPIQYYCLYRCWQRAEKEEAQPWDVYDFDYSLADRKAWQERLLMVFLAAALARCLWGCLAIPMAATRPPHRGEGLTSRQYAENVNDTFAYVMGLEGVCQQTDGSYAVSGKMLSRYGSEEAFNTRHHQILEEENGCVISVNFRIDHGVEPPEQVFYYGDEKTWHRDLICASWMALTGKPHPQTQALLEEHGIFDPGASSTRAVPLNGWVLTAWPEGKDILCYSITRQEGYHDH